MFKTRIDANLERISAILFVVCVKLARTLLHNIFIEPDSESTALEWTIKIYFLSVYFTLNRLSSVFMYVSQGRLGMDTNLQFCRRLIEGVEICLTHIQSNLG